MLPFPSCPSFPKTLLSLSLARTEKKEEEESSFQLQQFSPPEKNTQEKKKKEDRDEESGLRKSEPSDRMEELKWC